MAQRNLSGPMRVYVWLSVLLFAGLGVSLLYSAWQEHELILHGKTVVAVAYDFRRDLKNYQYLRYHFQLGAGGPTYSCGDSIGRKNLAVSVRREVWDQAQKTGTVSVVYDVRNPWNNEVADDARPPWLSALAAVGLVVFAYLLWWMMKNKMTSRGVAKEDVPEFAK
jgi:hypothetical protein